MTQTHILFWKTWWDLCLFPVRARRLFHVGLYPVMVRRCTFSLHTLQSSLACQILLLKLPPRCFFVLILWKKDVFDSLVLFLFNCFGCGFDLISIHYNEDSQQQCGFEIHCTSGEALLVQEAAASGQFTQQKRVLVYEWLFLVLACCFLPRIHDCKLNCSCWFIISLLGYKVGLLSNSSFGKQNKTRKTTRHLCCSCVPLV